MKAFVLLVTLLAGSAAACAQTVYRCGPEGRVYSQAPCPQGQAIDVSDERSPQQRAAAEQVARQEQSRGDQLERERLHREAVKPPLPGELSPRSAPHAASAPPPRPSKRIKRKPHREPEDFKAVAPAHKTLPKP